MRFRFLSGFLAISASVLLLAACSEPSRIGTTAPPIQGESWINVPSGAKPSLEGKILLVTFFSPT
jgi:uncharacterized lipoprotein YajG